MAEGDSKPFYLSKTLWLNILTPILAVLTNKLGVAAVTGDETAGFLVLANLVLRLVTKGAVTIS